jgi:U4/U6.U5 tri-snRNP component SNU23|uniref:Uncharacterized protein n=1 Tax=Aegilops tauschii subsp. strangulata TaxID=200361 RepID=A0A453D3Y6_AEGTS
MNWFQKEQAGQNEPEDIDPDVAAMMGFGGFGTSSKK